PESSGLIMRRCQGCNVNQPSHNPYTVKNRSYNYNCLGRYSAYTAVVFPKNVKKSNDEYILPNSFFQFKQQAIALYQDRLNQQSSYFNMYKDESESDEDDNSDTTREEINDNNRSTNPIERNPTLDVLEFIRPVSVVSKLREFRLLFNNRTDLHFYTDGSLKHSDQTLVNMGCAWIETSNPEEYRFSVQCTDRVGLVRSGPVQSQKDRSFSLDRTGPGLDRLIFKKICPTIHLINETVYS